MFYFYVTLAVAVFAFAINNKKQLKSLIDYFGGFGIAITSVANIIIIFGLIVMFITSYQEDVDAWLLVLQFVVSICTIVYILKPFTCDEKDKSDLPDNTDDNMRTGNRVRRTKRTMVHDGVRNSRLRDGGSVYHWRAGK